MRCNDRMKTHCIIQSCLNMSRSPRSCPIKVRHTNSNRLRSSFKIRTYRSCKHSELILIRRLYSNHRIDSKHIWSDIKRCSGTIRRNIRCICPNSLYDSINKSILRENRHLQPFCRVNHARRIQIRAECNDTPVFRRICFHTFKHSLCILKHPCALIHHNIGILCQTALIPFSILIIRNIPLVCLYILKSYICPIKILLFHNKVPPFLHLEKQSYLSAHHYNTAVFKNQERALFFSCTIFSYHFSTFPSSVLLTNTGPSEVSIFKTGVHPT